MPDDAMPAPSVHLVTVLYNSADALPGFLDSLAAQTLADWRLTVVDNASRDRSHDLVAARTDSRISLIRNERNLGFGRAANRGLRTAADGPGDFFVVINNDTRFGPTFLAELVAARDAHDAQVIAPRIMLLDDPARSWYAGGHFDRGWLFLNVHDSFDAADAREHGTVEFASGCCIGLRRDVLETVGLFDESFFVYWEDADLSLRLKLAGVPIHYVRDPHLLHEGGASSGGERSHAYDRLYFRSYAVMLRRHFGAAHALATVARLARQEVERRNPAKAIRIVRAMLAGMIVRLRPVPRLAARSVRAALRSDEQVASPPTAYRRRPRPVRSAIKVR